MDLHDPTNGTSEPTRYWSTANIGEAMPDVLSPMCWSFWGPGLEAGARLAYRDFGILPKEELRVPDDPNELTTSYFFGRPAMNLDRLRSLFDCIPGMTADDFERDVAGTVREGLPPVPKSGRTIHVIARAPAAMATTGRRVRRVAADQRSWWSRPCTAVAVSPTLCVSSRTPRTGSGRRSGSTSGPGSSSCPSRRS